MIEIADDEANIQFPSLLDRAEHGEVIVITRDGRPVVRMEPVTPHHDPERAREAIRRLRAYARQHPIPGVTSAEIKAWIVEGRP